MAQFKYTLPSGAEFVMESPDGTTQDQADYTFYSQVVAGALVGMVAGQSITGTTSVLAKFDLSRLERGTAGIDDLVILAIVNGLPTINTATGSIPSLIDVPLTNPVTQANIAAISGSGFTSPAIGTLTSDQTQALMAQVVNTVDQPSTVITNDKGVGQYGFSCQNLEMAGYIKPNTWQRFIQPGPSTLIEVLGAPGVWTGLNGIFSLEDFLDSPAAQNDAQAKLMQNGYDSLQAAGIIKTPTAQSLSAVVGTVYTGSNVALTNATATITDSVNGQIAALVTNSSQYGTALTAQWASGLPPVTNVTSNLVGIQGAQPVVGAFNGRPGVGSLTSGVTVDLMTVKTAMDTLGKASQFAASATGVLKGSIGSLSNISLSGIGAKLEGSATALAGQIQGQATALLTNAAGQIQGQANAILAQAQGQINALIKQGDSLVSSVQQAAGFVNTVNRASVDTAFTKILGNPKISVPNFGVNLPSSASIGAALDISKAQSVLNGLQTQARSAVSRIG